jgi:hypothetical protein
MTEYLIWLPRARSGDIEILGPPSDEARGEIHLYDGLHLDPQTVLHYTVEEPGELPDFLYNLRLLLIVSDNALEVISGSLNSTHTVHPVRIITEDGGTIDQYKWVNIHLRQSLLNENAVKHSIKTSSGHYVRIDNFSVRDDAPQTENVFICSETGSKVFPDSVVSRVTEAGLTGAVFTRLEGMDWPF